MLFRLITREVMADLYVRVTRIELDAAIPYCSMNLLLRLKVRPIFAVYYKNQARANLSPLLANLAVVSTSRRVLKPPQGEDPRRTQGPTRPPIWHDPTVCPRVQTVTNLWSLICEFRVVQCRGTPTSGKTILARLLKNFVTENHPDMQVVYLSWPSTTPDSQYQWPFDRMLKEYAQIEYNEIFALSNLLLICDEAQNSYPFTSFWNDFIKLQAAGAQGGPYVAMFSSFGSPSPSAVTFPGSAPPYLSREQRIPLRPFNDNNESLSLYFPRSEYDDVITRVCDTRNRNNPSQLFLPSGDLLNHLFDITSGHPGCIRAILSVLIHSNVGITNLVPFHPPVNSGLT